MPAVVKGFGKHKEQKKATTEYTEILKYWDGQVFRAKKKNFLRLQLK